MAERVSVTCYAGYKADERPTSFTQAGQTFLVTEVIDRWYDRDGNYFRVVVEGGAEHLLKHDLNEDVWELVPPRIE